VVRNRPAGNINDNVSITGTGALLMKQQLRMRFWLEIGMASITGTLFVVTLIWKAWIEVVFGVEPDAGSGMLEWLIVGILLFLTIALFNLAGYEWRFRKLGISPLDRFIVLVAQLALSCGMGSRKSRAVPCW
jgi:hypothetical protein